MTREEKAIRVLDDMKVKIDIPKAAVTQIDKNWALDMAIEALKQEPCCNCIEFKRYAKEMGFEIEQQPCTNTVIKPPAVKTVILDPDVTPEDLENDEGIQYCVGPTDDTIGAVISVYSKDNCIRLNNKTDLRNLIDAIIDALPMEE